MTVAGFDRPIHLPAAGFDRPSSMPWQSLVGETQGLSFLVPAPGDAPGTPHRPSLEELERSCRRLDAMNVRIAQIDLSCVDGNSKETPGGVQYRFELEKSPQWRNTGTVEAAMASSVEQWSAGTVTVAGRPGLRPAWPRQAGADREPSCSGRFYKAPNESLPRGSVLESPSTPLPMRKGGAYHTRCASNAGGSAADGSTACISKPTEELGPSADSMRTSTGTGSSTRVMSRGKSMTPPELAHDEVPNMARSSSTGEPTSSPQQVLDTWRSLSRNMSWDKSLTPPGRALDRVPVAGKGGSSSSSCRGPRLPRPTVNDLSAGVGTGTRAMQRESSLTPPSRDLDLVCFPRSSSSVASSSSTPTPAAHQGQEQWVLSPGSGGASSGRGASPAPEEPWPSASEAWDVPEKEGSSRARRVAGTGDLFVPGVVFSSSPRGSDLHVGPELSTDSADMDELRPVTSPDSEEVWRVLESAGGRAKPDKYVQKVARRVRNALHGSKKTLI